MLSIKFELSKRNH